LRDDLGDAGLGAPVGFGVNEIGETRVGMGAAGFGAAGFVEALRMMLEELMHWRKVFRAV
jgi:hypothetical protein